MQNNIFGRRYFYPLISQFDEYNKIASASRNNLPISEKISKEVICIPIYPDLELEIIEKIRKVIATP